MPSPKRWFPKSRDFNDDPEGWELTDTFGDRTVRLWDEICAILDKTDNHWRVSGEWLASLSRKVRQSSATVWRAIGWMVEKHWLVIEELAADGSPLVYSSPNFWKYHKKKETKGESKGSTTESDKGPSLPNLPNLPNKEEEEEKNKRAQAPLVVLPDWLPEKEWEEFKTHRKRKRAPLTDSITERVIGVLRELRDLGHDPAAVLTEAVDRNWTGIKVDWIHKPGEQNGKTPAEPKGFAGLRGFLAAHSK